VATARRCVLRGERPSLATLADWCAATADAFALAPDGALALDLCLTELVTNIIDYAYPAAAPAPIVIDAESEGGRLLVTLWDAGPPFDPLTVPPPQPVHELSEVGIGGLGIDLVRQFSSELAHTRVDDWNRLQFSPTGRR
jgi:anti-sigma regulatory factor (Ser/Thr protein kinase)